MKQVGNWEVQCVWTGFDVRSLAWGCCPCLQRHQQCAQSVFECLWLWIMLLVLGRDSCYIFALGLTNLVVEGINICQMLLLFAAVDVHHGTSNK